MTKGRIARRAFIEDWMILLLRTPQQRLPVIKGRTTHNIDPSRGISRPHLIMIAWAHMSQSPNGISIGFKPFLRSTFLWSTHRHWHTDDTTCDICSNRPHHIALGTCGNCDVA